MLVQGIVRSVAVLVLLLMLGRGDGKHTHHAIAYWPDFFTGDLRHVCCGISLVLFDASSGLLASYVFEGALDVL